MNQKIDINLASKEYKIIVYSCGIGYSYDVESIDFSLFDVIYGSKSLLDEYLFEKLDLLSCVAIGAKAKEDSKNIIKFAKEGKKILVLCSGDGLYHGFGGTILKSAEEENLEEFIKESILFIPNVTAFQDLFHKIAMPWSDATLFSVHNYSKLPLRKILTSHLPVVYGGNKFSASKIAQEILEYNPNLSNNKAVVAEYLGSKIDGKSERIVQSSLKEISEEKFSPTSILILLETTEILENSYLPLGLEESFYDKDENLITASDARAIILSRLRLPYKGVLWDLGAGSGSVGLEAAALCLNLEVYAVEKNEKRISDIEANRKKLGICNYKIYQSDILEKLGEESLENPDRIFIGGGGKNIIKIAELAKNFLNENGIMVISAVTLESFTALHAWKKSEKKVSCLKLDIAKERVIANEYTSFKQSNTLYIFIYQK